MIDAHKDASNWCPSEARSEYEQMIGPLYDPITDLVGGENCDHFLYDRSSMVRVLEAGELWIGYYSARNLLSQ
ncbi:MAG: hypothetical protein WBM41_14620 [Arenicellales bacterium]